MEFKDFAKWHDLENVADSVDKVNQRLDEIISKNFLSEQQHSSLRGRLVKAEETLYSKFDIAVNEKVKKDEDKKDTLRLIGYVTVIAIGLFGALMANNYMGSSAGVGYSLYILSVSFTGFCSGLIYSGKLEE